MAICHRANLSIYMVQAFFQPTKESNKKPELDFLHTRHYSTFIHSTPPMKSIAQPPFAGDAVSVEVPSNTRLIPGSDGYLVNIALLPCYNSTPKDIMDNSFAIDMSFYRLANSVLSPRILSFTVLQPRPNNSITATLNASRIQDAPTNKHN